MSFPVRFLSSGILQDFVVRWVCRAIDISCSIWYRLPVECSVDQSSFRGARVDRLWKVFRVNEREKMWEGFPRGLRILVADEDPDFLAAIKLKLESFHYFVTTFLEGDLVRQALETEPCSFHLALLEAMSKNIRGSQILARSRCIPIILISSTEDMDMIMRSIEAGAADILQKPISDEKLKNLWQHVARKALNTKNASSLWSFSSVEMEKPQLEQSSNNSLISDNPIAIHDENVLDESQPVRKINTDDNSNDQPSSSNIVNEEEKHEDEQQSVQKPVRGADRHRCQASCRTKERRSSMKNKAKVDWSPELHRLFVQAVEELGTEKAIPSRILEIMGVKSLTRHNVASHLQKYRAQRKRKHCLVKDDCTPLHINKRTSIQIHPRPSVPYLYPCVPGHVWGHPAQGWHSPNVWHQPNTASGWSMAVASGKACALRPAGIPTTPVTPETPLPIGLTPPSVDCVVKELNAVAKLRRHSL